MPLCYITLSSYRHIVKIHTGGAFNIALLQNAEFVKKLRNNLKIFLEINSETAASPQILWETTKCFIRGEALSFATHLKVTKRHRITQLEDEI